MTAFLLGALVGAAIATVAEGYFLMGRAQLLLTTGEQILAACHLLLRQVPGKSAPRTTAPAGPEPRRGWRRLIPEMVPVEAPPATGVRTDTTDSLAVVDVGLPELLDAAAEPPPVTTVPARGRHAAADDPLEGPPMSRARPVPSRPSAVAPPAET